MPKDDDVCLGHMLDVGRKILEKTQGITRRDYDDDENLRLALAHLIQVIGEAARRVSEASRVAHPQIPWKAIVGMRHKVVHDYMNVDEDIVWATAVEELPGLIAELEKILGQQAGHP